MKKILITLIGLLIILGLSFTIPMQPSAQSYETSIPHKLAQNFEEIADPIVATDIISYSYFRSQIAIPGNTISQMTTALASKKIRIDTAEDLYNFSADVNYNSTRYYVTASPETYKLSVITFLMGRHYVLGNDIDYSVMLGRQFLPIGFNFKNVDDTIDITAKFTGIFDGQGFEISNLYVAGYDYVITIQGSGTTEREQAMSLYYSMFTAVSTTGIIRNLGLVNPILELNEEHEDMHQTANLVGYNEGTVDHVYVIDNRTNIYTAGIRMKVASGTSTILNTAAGIVHTNAGTFTNAYFASILVVNASYITNFTDTVEPLVYLNYNSHTGENLVYDQSIYLGSVNLGGTPTTIKAPSSSLAIGQSTIELKDESTSALNGTGTNWFFFKDERYPSLLGLEYDDTLNTFYIDTALDLKAFSKIIHYEGGPEEDTSYRRLNYLIREDIDMSVLAPGAYKTSRVEFAGTLSGAYTDGGVSKSHYINNLSIENGYINEEIYYSGMFSVLTGDVSRIVFSGGSLQLTNTGTNYSNEFRIGLLAGELSYDWAENATNTGTITDVSANVNIGIGTTSIGSVSMGGLVGVASGQMTNIYVKGTVDGKDHDFILSYDIDAVYNLGGIIGSTGSTKLVLSNVLNEATVLGLTNDTSITTSNSSIEMAIGGVIGRLTNTTTAYHDLFTITNEGTIQVKNFKAGKTVNQYASGVIGLSTGVPYTLDQSFGIWTNRGNIVATSVDSNNNVYASGVLVSNHSSQVEFIFLYNEGTFQTPSSATFMYTSLVYDISSTGVILSQSSNDGDHSLSINYPNMSGVFYSKNNAPSLLRFVENKGDITYTGVSITSETKIAGISTSSNIDYLNVYYSGTILLKNVTSTVPLWIAGIAHSLTGNTTPSLGKYIKNSLNQGSIMTANLSSTANTYIGGIVNINYAGDLHNQDSSNLPVATTGIMNTVNSGMISSTESLSSSSYGVYGTGNLYASGIATLNQGSIQNSANLGNITFAQRDETISADTFDIAFTSDVAGRINTFYGGLTLGGISAVSGSGRSRIYDNTNSGDIIGVAKNYVRSGGVLAVSILNELTAGGISTQYIEELGSQYTTSNPAPTSVQIAYSILSNCINYGSVSAMTSTIGEYDRETLVSQNSQYYIYYSSAHYRDGDTLVMVSKQATVDRPPIYASAGGIIAYGLSTMRRMINHGNIGSTDVAGGIVGATYVLGSTSGSVETIVNIDTAIHYGEVRAFKASEYANVEKRDLQYSNIWISQNLYATDDDFIVPTTTVNNNDVSRFPEHKRGIGGIFGRLQRGVNGYMTSEGGNFNFIVNADDEVDLIGRLDQVLDFTSSARYFRFTNCKYYSAKPNDTTQAVFTGFIISRYSATDTITKNGTIYIRGSYYSYRNAYLWSIVTAKYATQRVSSTSPTLIQKIGITLSTYPSSQQTTIPNEWIYISSTTSYQAANWKPTTIYIEETTVSTTRTTDASVMMGNIPIPLITETNGNPGQYIYDEDFEMRKDSTILSNGEPITAYIYYVDGALLSPTFSNIHPNGMYVLSTSGGSTLGSVLPTNLNLPLVYRIDGVLGYDADYGGVPIDNRDPLDSTIIAKYTALIQTLYNDKSSLLNTETTLILTEQAGGAGSTLQNGVVSGNVITFDISLEAFGTIDATEHLVSYDVSSALLSLNALLAARIEDYNGGSYTSHLNDFRTILYPDRAANISTIAPPVLSIDLSSYRNITTQTSPISIGYFSVYSEAALNNTVFLVDSYYTTDYEVKLILRPTLGSSSGTIAITTVQIDGSTITQANWTTASVQSTIVYTFTDNADILVEGYSIAPFVKLYYGSEEVLSTYYTVVVTPVSSSGTFTVTFTMKEALRQGTYTFSYKYFAASTALTQNFTNAKSTQKTITALSHYSSTGYTLTGTTYQTNINFGVNLGLAALTPNSTISVTPVAISGAKPYLITNTYTTSIPNYNVTISPFATMTLVYNGYTYSNGLRTYQLTYTITDENQSSTTYIHNIVERMISIVSVYKNGNKVNINNVFASREADTTAFGFDLGLDSIVVPSLYKVYTEGATGYFDITYTGVSFEGVTLLPEEIIGLRARAGQFLYMDMNYLDEFGDYIITSPGNYTITIQYHRIDNGTDYVVTLASQAIRKEKGIYAYLYDIDFAPLGTDPSYPKIYESNRSGDINESSIYSIYSYYAGIDYGTADLNEIRDFRVDGTVANTPLDDFSPYMLDFLPAGAKIQRYTYDSVTETWSWTIPVNKQSSEADKATLYTDFTVNPETGEEGDEETDIIITYRVIAETDLVYSSGELISDDTAYDDNGVYYHVTVIDRVYNVTIVFTVYYVISGQDPILAHIATPLTGKTILINVKNFTTNLPAGDVSVDNVADFPVYTTYGTNNNDTNLFFTPVSDNYRYSFGRNISGYYAFVIVPPRNAASQQIYDYYITFNGTALTNVVGGEGKYFYINNGTKNRTRRFNIYITPLTNIPSDGVWGLYDYFISWN
ncbi:MAG: hypothetical protein WCT17_00265 [Bacilli bacterium]